ncbi:MAG: RodZ domain-containing protein [Acetobacter persici]|uniref:helix-turn-helix domain-containing protein n=1 Tax=Acetobacter persici TaxID=1076596 RepID=UPI0039E7A690
MSASSGAWIVMAEPGSVPEQEPPAFSPPLPDVESLGVGAALRARREQLGWSLADVAAWLRIRESYLEALESGRAGVFPAEAYALGFLRTYGTALGFDASTLVQRYKREGKSGGQKPDLTFPAPQPDRRIPPGVSVSLGLAVILASYVGWYHFIGHAPPAPEHVPPVAAIIPGAQTSNTPSPQVASILPGPGAVPSRRPDAPAASAGALAGSSASSAQTPPAGSVPAPQQTAQNPDFTRPAFPAEQDGSVGADGAAARPAGDAALAANPQAATAPPGAEPPQPVPAVPDNQITLKAIAPSWVQVRDASGKVAYDHIMQVGDQWAVPADGGPYSLTVGNAGGVVLSAGAVTTQPLGKNGAVRRKLILTPEAVKDGSLAGTTQSAPAGGVTPAPAATPAGVGGSSGPAMPENKLPADAGVVGAGASVAGQALSVGPNGQPVAPSQGAAGQPPAPPRPRPRRQPVEQHDSSADDLNARQLQGITGH